MGLLPCAASNNILYVYRNDDTFSRKKQLMTSFPAWFRYIIKWRHLAPIDGKWRGGGRTRMYTAQLAVDGEMALDSFGFDNSGPKKPSNTRGRGQGGIKF